MADIGLNSEALLLIAKTMRDQTSPPHEEMPYSQYAGAVSTYAVINAMELIASGLKAEEKRKIDERQLHIMKLAYDPGYRQSYLDADDDISTEQWIENEMYKKEHNG